VRASSLGQHESRSSPTTSPRFGSGSTRVLAVRCVAFQDDACRHLERGVGARLRVGHQPDGGEVAPAQLLHHCVAPVLVALADLHQMVPACAAKPVSDRVFWLVELRRTPADPCCQR